MALPESFLEQLRDRIEIEDVISSYMVIKRRGKNLVGLCPFHGEKTGSFTVFPATQSYYCFGCGAGGDAITFIRNIENLDYIDAVKLLATRAGLEMPETQRDDDGFKQKRDTTLAINKAAANFYFQCLAGSEGKIGLEYFRQRMLTTKTVKHYALGYAPDSWDSLIKYLNSLGYEYEQIRTAGLCSKSKDGRYYDYFRNRVMFPIVDVRGNVIGFGGRVIDKDDSPKYLNSPDTPVFKKSLNLYSLNNAKNSGDTYILAEGYMDVIALWQAGFTNAVATLGTAITSEQAKLIDKYAKQVIICYDADEAGRKATQRAISILNETRLKVKVLRISGGKDPDEFIKAYGADKFSALLSNSGNHVEFKLMDARSRYNIELADEKASYMKEAIDILVSIRSQVERDIYAGELAKELDIEKQAILVEIAKKEKFNNKKQSKQEIKEEISKIHGKGDMVNPEKQRNLLAAKAEEGILCILMYHQDLFSNIYEQIKPDEFVTEFNKKVYECICTIVNDGAVVDLMSLGQYFTAQEMSGISALIAKQDTIGGDMDTALEYIETIRDYKSKKSLEALGEIDSEKIEDYIEALKRKKRGE